MSRLLWYLMLPSLAWGEAALVAWDYDKPHPEAFVLTMASPQGTDTLRVPASRPGACDAAGDVTRYTYCAQLPSCPAPGAYTITIQAVHAGDTGPASDPQLCVVTMDTPCACMSDDQLQAMAAQGQAMATQGQAQHAEATVPTPAPLPIVTASMPTFPTLAPRPGT